MLKGENSFTTQEVNGCSDKIKREIGMVGEKRNGETDLINVT